HRADDDHFGDYDFTAKFTTVDGVLTSIYFDSENWNKEINATTYSQDAIDDLLDQLRAQETLNAEGLDNVTGATRSSDGIKAVITEALADEALGIKSVAEDVEVTFNVTDDNKGSGRGEGGGNHGGETTEPVTAEQTYSGSVHRADDDHFGDYDFTAKFTTVDGVLTSIYFDSENWNKEINATTYSQDAIDDLLDQLRAQETLNAEGLDNVTGATRSSDGIKAVITEALADEALGIKSVAEDVEVTFNVTDDNKGSGRGEGGGKPTTPSVSEVFSDVQADQWYTEAIQYVYTNGIMAGMGNGTFGTQENLTRAHIAQILYNVEGKPEVSSTSKFSDVQNKSSWYYTAVVWANENGIMAGYGKGKFGPQDTLTREQMATVLYNYAKYKQEDVSATTDLSSYTDANQISGWAQTPMKWAVATEVISGTTETTLAPLGFCTRAQAAQMMANRQK
ncbi:MAG: S-layer homology domain-containing protein, partial [Clostridia bacterium]|nr:S-layer homology domain-containing protein [Clostridia bacterium]